MKLRMVIITLFGVYSHKFLKLIILSQVGEVYSRNEVNHTELKYTIVEWKNTDKKMIF